MFKKATAYQQGIETGEVNVGVVRRRGEGWLVVSCDRLAFQVEVPLKDIRNAEQQAEAKAIDGAEA